MDIVKNAITFDEKSKSELMISMQNITNLDNPNSVVQMKQWLSDNGIEAESLGKKDVAAMIKNTDGDVATALKLRLQLAKSSVKKYQYRNIPLGHRRWPHPGCHHIATGRSTSEAGSHPVPHSNPVCCH